MIERIGGSGRAQRVRADLEAERGRVGTHQLVEAVRGDRLVELPQIRHHGFAQNRG
jgi:hypothetical protein